MDDKELEEIAAEYALGTLSPEEWHEAKARLQSDPKFAHRVSSWDYRLAPLDVKDGDVVPPFGIWHKISNRLDELAANEGKISTLLSESLPDEDDRRLETGRPETGWPETGRTEAGWIEAGQQDLALINSSLDSLRRSRNRWRSGFAGAVALAAGFIGLQVAGVHIPFLPQPQVEGKLAGQAKGKFVAVLNPSGTTPGFLIKVDVGARQLKIERLVDKAPSGKDYELWLIEPEQEPKPVLVVGREKHQNVGFSQLQPDTQSDKPLTFAISLEPEGGSPTGKVTGAVLFTGQLISR